MSAFAELSVGSGRGVFWGRETGFALLTFEHASEVPRFPVVDTSSMIVESDAGIAPSSAGELFVEACGEHGPFSTVGVADDADAGWINFGQVCEKVPAVGGHGGEEGERLPPLHVWFGFSGVAAG